MKTECIFCMIVDGSMPSYKVYEDEKVLAFLDIHPVNPGHALVIPKTHAANIFEVSLSDWAAVCDIVHKLAPAIDTALEADGVNVMMSNREHAGQTVHHAHVHLIPRHKHDGLKLWPHGRYEEGEADAVKEKVRGAL